jgi:hypothetical protein
VASLRRIGTAVLRLRAQLLTEGIVFFAPNAANGIDGNIFDRLVATCRQEAYAETGNRSAAIGY